MGDEREFRRVAVLMGGPSEEREVSLNSGKAIASGLSEAGYDVLPIDLPDRNVDIPSDIEAVFIALHGTFGEDGQVQAMLDARHVPYTGSGSKASELAFDKVHTKRMFVEKNIPSPAYEVLGAGDRRTLSLPVVTKPARQGSSIGVHRVFDEKDWDAALADTLSFDGVAIVEEYIAGHELTVGIVDEQALPLIEIRAPDDWYSYKAKYTKGQTEYLVPAPVGPGVSASCQRVAMETFAAFGCRGFARVDMRITEAGDVFVLELNSIPGFTETSLLPKAAAATGMPFPALCSRIMRTAVCDPSG